jgi:hypothetical protein
MPSQQNRDESEEWSRLFRVLLIFTSAFALAFGVGTLVRASEFDFLPF